MAERPLSKILPECSFRLSETTARRFGEFVVVICFTPLSHEIADSLSQCPTPNTFNYHFAQTSQAKSWFLAATSATRQPKMIQEAPRWRLGAPRWPQKGPVQSATNTVLQTKSKRNQDGPPQCPPRLPQSVFLSEKTTIWGTWPAGAGSGHFLFHF